MAQSQESIINETEYGTQVYEQMKIYWNNLSAGIERLLEEEEE